VSLKPNVEWKYLYPGVWPKEEVVKIDLLWRSISVFMRAAFMGAAKIPEVACIFNRWRFSMADHRRCCWGPDLYFNFYCVLLEMSQMPIVDVFQR
jgi:hypothetical protein